MGCGVQGTLKTRTSQKLSAGIAIAAEGDVERRRGDGPIRRLGKGWEGGGIGTHISFIAGSIKGLTKKKGKGLHIFPVI